MQGSGSKVWRREAGKWKKTPQRHRASLSTNVSATRWQSGCKGTPQIKGNSYTTTASLQLHLLHVNTTGALPPTPIWQEGREFSRRDPWIGENAPCKKMELLKPDA
jgi:hypothetical protein